MKNPKISIIVPVYNVSAYIERCVKSLLAQTFDDLEIILVNDGCTDDSMQKIQPLIQDNSFIRIINQENQGLSAARNSGIKIAKGDYFIFVDSDDFIPANFCKVTYQAAKDHNADLVIANDKKLKYPIEYYLKKMENKKFRLQCFTGIISWSAYGKIYKNNLFENNFFPVGRLYEDGVLIPKIVVEARKIFITNDTRYFYCPRESNIMSRSFFEKKNLADKIFALQFFLHLAKQYNVSGFYQQSFLANQLQYIQLLKNLGYKKSYKLIKKDFDCNFSFFFIYFLVRSYRILNQWRIMMLNPK